MAVVAVGGLSMAQYDKAVSLSLDGETSSVHVFGSTVGDLLAKQEIAVGEHDLVQPAADASLGDGDTVVWGTSCSDPSCNPVVWDRP